MDLSAVGRAVLIAREGLRLEAYRDSVGIWTIGVGHTAAAGPPLPRAGLRIGAEEADAIFARDVARFVRTVAEAIPEPLPQHAFDALVSLSFNIGPAAFLRSTVLRCLRAGDRDGAAGARLPPRPSAAPRAFRGAASIEVFEEQREQAVDREMRAGARHDLDAPVLVAFEDHAVDEIGRFLGVAGNRAGQRGVAEQFL